MAPQYINLTKILVLQFCDHYEDHRFHVLFPSTKDLRLKRMICYIANKYFPNHIYKENFAQTLLLKRNIIVSDLFMQINFIAVDEVLDIYQI
jgi:hypothetical protein